jgi:hypothetical protein
LSACVGGASNADAFGFKVETTAARASVVRVSS